VDVSKEMKVKRRPAVFIDRDGTINEQMGYINHLSRFRMLPGVGEAIRLLNERDLLVIVISNQSGVARGYFPMDLVHRVHDLMKEALEKSSARVDAVFFCPHYPTGSVPEYTMQCNCRKPKTGLVEEACRSFDIDLKNSFVVGDRYTEIELSRRLNIKGILVRTGYGLGEIEYILPGKPAPDHIADDLLDAARWIIGKVEPGGQRES